MILVLKSENSEIHIPVMSSADILMVSKLPVWVLSSRDLGARCPTFSVPAAAPCVPCAEQLSLVSDVWCHMCCGQYLHVRSVPGPQPRLQSAVWQKWEWAEKILHHDPVMWPEHPNLATAHRQQDRPLIAKMNLHKTKHIFATCLSVSEYWCVNTLTDFFRKYQMILKRSNKNVAQYWFSSRPECLSRFSEFSPLSGVSGDIAAAVGFTSIFVSRKL